LLPGNAQQKALRIASAPVIKVRNSWKITHAAPV
jgi:hypothetical protein